MIGNRGDVVEVPMESLLSPKPIIEDIGPRGGDWGRAYRGTQRGEYRIVKTNYNQRVTIEENGMADTKRVRLFGEGAAMRDE